MDAIQVVHEGSVCAKRHWRPTRPIATVADIVVAQCVPPQTASQRVTFSIVTHFEFGWKTPLRGSASPLLDIPTRRGQAHRTSPRSVLSAAAGGARPGDWSGGQCESGRWLGSGALGRESPSIGRGGQSRGAGCWRGGWSGSDRRESIGCGAAGSPLTLPLDGEQATTRPLQNGDVCGQISALVPV